MTQQAPKKLSAIIACYRDAPAVPIMHERLTAVFNKIGTYAVAVLAHEHKIPFYVAAPKSTFDLSRKASEVEVEERKPEEVTHIGGVQIAPNGVNVMNPSFDPTPLKYVTAIITEDRVIYSKDFGEFRKGKV